MNKKINIMLKTLIILTLITSIGITVAEASLQIITIDVVPDNAGTVQVWKNYPDVFMGFVTTTKNFDFDTSDSIAIVPFNNMGSEYNFTKQCDDVECIAGVYVGPLYQYKLIYDVKVYYEKISIQTPTPIPTSTSTLTPTSSLHIVNLKLSSSVDIITAIVTTTGSGKLGIDLDTKALVFTKNVTNDGETKAEIKASLGEHTVCVRDVNNNKEIKCESIEIKPTSTSKSTSTPEPTSTPTSTSTSTPEPTTNKMKATTSDTYGRINIVSDPSEADIFMNNIPYGNTPYSANVEIGSYSLKITKDGYKDFTKMVNIRESTPTDIIAKLLPINETSNTESNQTNQSAMMDNGNPKQNNGDSTTSLINNMILLAAIVVIVSGCIIYRILFPQKNTYINYAAPPSTTNEKSMIVLNRVNR